MGTPQLEHRIRVTDLLELDLDREQWLCGRCGHELGPARENYKYGCLMADRGFQGSSASVFDGELSCTPHPAQRRIIEFYCPACAAQIETECLQSGSPFTPDSELELDRIKERLRRGEFSASPRRQSVQ